MRPETVIHTTKSTTGQCHCQQTAEWTCIRSPRIGNL